MVDGHSVKAEGISCKTSTGEVLRVREVWQDNLTDEMQLIRQVVDDYPFLAMDTEFPGVVARPVGNFKNSGEYHYQTLRFNVDMLKLIQLGMTFVNSQGTLPTFGGELCVWQFNFREFKMSDDMYAQDSIELLKQSGIDFPQNEKRGIDVHEFGELLMTSGVVLNNEVQWITFHSSYDFGYLLKVVTCQPLPDTESAFFELLRIYFPDVYDIKYLMKFCSNLHGGLNKLAETLEVERVGPQHQAGSDSLLTASTFLRLKDTCFSGFEAVAKHKGILYGLGADGNNELNPGPTDGS